jgi:NADPH2:quinone reductase
MSLDQKMTVARVLERGAARFELAEVPIPTPGPGQVLVRVESAGVNFSDVKRRRGDAYPFETAFPFVPGGEIAGTIVGVGEGVRGLARGTPVFALAGANGFGGYAQYALSYASTAIPVPAGLSLDQASVFLVAGSTAKVMLQESARLRAGESVLVPAATGGVGSFALQIARQLGAGKIIAAVGGPSKFARARALGAHEVIDASAPDWPERARALTDGKGLDVVLEATGGDSVERSLRALASFGRLVVFGAATGVSGGLSRGALESLFYAPAPNQSVMGFNIGGWFMERPDVAGRALLELMNDVMSGVVRTPEIRTMPLARAQEAHTLLEQRRVEGKLVLKPWA